MDRQPRERAVPCRYCRQDTWNLSAVCDLERCKMRHMNYGRVMPGPKVQTIRVEKL